MLFFVQIRPSLANSKKIVLLDRGTRVLIDMSYAWTIMFTVDSWGVSRSHGSHLIFLIITHHSPKYGQYIRFEWMLHLRKKSIEMLIKSLYFQMFTNSHCFSCLDQYFEKILHWRLNYTLVLLILNNTFFNQGLVELFENVLTQIRIHKSNLWHLSSHLFTTKP